MAVDAQDALLKTLEEPPAASVFVLVTTRPDMLLPTVRSRCQRLRFGRWRPATWPTVLMRRSRIRGGGRARGGGRCGWQHRPRARGQRRGLRRRARRRGRRCCRARGVTPIRGAGSTAPRRSAGRRQRSRRAARAGFARPSSMLSDLGALLSRADERALANADLKPLLDAG